MSLSVCLSVCLSIFSIVLRLMTFLWVMTLIYC